MVRKLWGIVGFVAVLSLFGCNDFLGTQRIVYTGYVIDGSTGQRLTSYSMSIQSGDVEYGVEVDGAGRFTTDETRGNTAYFVSVSAPGYRPFEAGESGDGGGTSPADVQLREVVLFPEGLVSPAVQLDVINTDNDEYALAGSVRLVPITGNSSFDIGDTIDSTTRWRNDLDQQNEVITADFTNSTVTIADGGLVFGVQYRVDVFNVPNFSARVDATRVTGGFDIGRVIDLTALSDAPPVLITDPDDFCVGTGLPNLNPIPGLTTVVNLDFNEAIELVDADDVDALSVTIDEINNGGITLNPAPDDDETVVVSGTSVQLQWNPSERYATFDTTSDPPDRLNFLRFNNLFSIRIRRVGSTGSQTTLGNVASSSITCTENP